MGRIATLVATLATLANQIRAFRSHTPSTPLAVPTYYEVPCPVLPASASVHRLPGCTPGLTFTHTNGSTHTPPCGRYIQDDFLPPEDISALLDMVERGFVYSTVPGGPSILDLNGGLLRDSHGMMDVYSGRNKRVAGAPKLGRRKTRVGRPRHGSNSSTPTPSASVPSGTGKAAFQPLSFTQAELQLYKLTFDRIRAKIMQIFGLQDLWFTAPTFVARIMGDTGYGLKPELQVQDKDKDKEGDFTHGGFAFLQHRNGTRNQELHLTSDLGFTSDWSDEHSVAPRAGRLLLFSSGQENVHAVHRVSSGVRYVFSMWFTCDADKEFATGRVWDSATDNGKQEL